MLVEDRYNLIKEMLGEERTVSVGEMAKKLYVSEATVRRDLTAMEKTGMIRRVHGGAVLVRQSNRDVPLYLRENVNAQAKDTIARKAAGLIRENDVILMDASSTAFALIPYLRPTDNLIVITNGIKAALELGKMHIKTLCTGGTMIDNSFSLVGHHAEEMIESISADLMFFSCLGVSAAGMINDTSIEEARLRQTMFKHSKRRVLLCDSSKFGKEYFYNLCHLSNIHDMISEVPLPEDWQRMMKNKRLRPESNRSLLKNGHDPSK